MAVRRLRSDLTGSAAVSNVSNSTGQAATNGTITNSSQGAKAVANVADLNTVEAALNSVIVALRAHGILNSA